jgi:hypothetical protein
MALPYALLADKQEDDCVDVRVMVTLKRRYNSRAPPEMPPHADSHTPPEICTVRLRCRQRGYRYSPYLHSDTFQDRIRACEPSATRLIKAAAQASK